MALRRLHNHTGPGHGLAPKFGQFRKITRALPHRDFDRQTSRPYTQQQRTTTTAEIWTGRTGVFAVAVALRQLLGKQRSPR